MTKRTVPILSWHSGSAFFELRIFGPEKYGGLGDRPSIYGLPVGEDGEYKEKDLKEVRLGIFLVSSLRNPKEMYQLLEMKSELVQLRGFPPFYDYEWYPYPPDVCLDQYRLIYYLMTDI